MFGGSNIPVSTARGGLLLLGSDNRLQVLLSSLLAIVAVAGGSAGGLLCLFDSSLLDAFGSIHIAW